MAKTSNKSIDGIKRSKANKNKADKPKPDKSNGNTDTPVQLPNDKDYSIRAVERRYNQLCNILSYYF